MDHNTRNPISPVKKKTAAKRPSRPIKNPQWLRDEPDGSAPDPPVRTQASLLPFTQLTWQDFERLCLRLSERGAKVEAAWSYGKPGYAQHGIDILVRMPDGSFHVWQSKRHSSMSKEKVKAAVRLFLKHKWAKEATRFVLAVACEFKSPALVEAIEEARAFLKAKKIEFESLDGSRLTERLRTEPELIDDFFKRPWVEAICPPEALERLKNRLSRFDLASVRTKLHGCYNSWISTVDPGLPIVGQDARGRTRASIPITQRYIQPDVLFQGEESEMPPAGDTAEQERSRGKEAAEAGQREPGPPQSGEQAASAGVGERRLPIDEYLCSKRQSVIVGEAGAGKTSLLRFIALDMLCEQPVLKVVEEHFKGALPVWVPFALWVRMSADQRAPAPIEEAVAGFFRALGESDLAEDMRRAVLGKRIVLLVDGLDEGSDPATAQTLIAVLIAFADRNGIPVVATSRPHGMRALSDLGGSWDRPRLAPLSDEQRRALARLWFDVLEDFEAAPGTTTSQITARGKRKADAFITALQVNAAITRLSQTPLFLLAFMTLHRRGQSLPRSRFDASKEIVDELVDRQPRRRDVSALGTQGLAGEPRLRDRVIADFAFALQSRELPGLIPDTAAEEDAIVRGAKVILDRQRDGDEERARVAARAIFSFTEERAGLLVNKAPGNIGFLHLSLQEYLAAHHLLQRSLDEKMSFVSANAGVVRWRETILYLLFLTINEAEAGELVEAIEKASVGDVQARAVRDALLTDAVFADFAHDLGVVRRIAAKCFAEVEFAAWGTRQRHLLDGVVDGLFSESIGGVCRAKIAEWMPDRHGYSRASAIDAIPTWDASLKAACIPALLRCLRCETEYVWRKAAQVLSVTAERDQDTKAKLMRLGREAPSVQTAQAAIACLGYGWFGDEDVGAVAESLRASSHDGLCLDAMRINAKRGQTDAGDLERFLSIAYGRERFSNGLVAPDLVEHFAVHHRAAFIEKLEAAIASQMGDRVGRVLPLAGSLVMCDSRNAVAHEELLQALSWDWVVHDLFSPNGFPVERVDWTPDLVARIEHHITAKDRVMESELYWISRVMRMPLLKQKFLDALRQREYLMFWCSRGLIEGWGKADPDVQTIFASMLDGDAEGLAQVAEELPLVIDDRNACRAALLRGLRADVSRFDFLLKGCRNLGITIDDSEMVDAAVQVGTRNMSPLYRDMWCSALIEAFPAHPEVRRIALEELSRRDGSLGAIARSYPGDREICDRILGVVCPLDSRARMVLVQSIEAAAPSSAAALELLRDGRQDTNGLVCAESIIGWVESALMRGPLAESDVEWLEAELDTVGPEYEKRRTAAVVGLLLSGNIDRFVRAKRYDGRPLDVDANPGLTRDDLYLRRLLARWSELTQALGGAKEAFGRLNIDPERTLRAIRGTIPNIEQVFGLLMEQVPTAQHVHKNDLIGALAAIEPQGNRMRELISSLLLGPVRGRTLADHWAELRAGEIFAEYFGSDHELRGRVIESFKADRRNEAAAGGLAEIVLREDAPDLKDLLVERVQGRRYGVGTHFKLIAALASCEVFIESVEELLTKNMDPDTWSFPYWVPALVRRIKRDSELQDKMFLVLGEADSVSLQATLFSLLRRSVGPTDNLKHYATSELRKLQGQTTPAIGFDLTSYAHRPLFQVLTELAL